MPCVLRASGRGFDVDGFLAGSPFAGAAVRTPTAARVASDASRERGFNVPVSDAGFDDLAAQVRDAIAFLDRFDDELRRLRRYEGVTTALDFGLARRDVAVQTDSFPPALLRRGGALDIALEVTQYAVRD